MSWFRNLFNRTGDGAPKRVDVTTAAQLQREGAVLLDVREQNEWSAGRAPKARHIPLGQLGQRGRELPAGGHILTICRSGGRSARAAAALRGMGFTVTDVAGGMRAWQGAGLPVVRSGGKTGEVI